MELKEISKNYKLNLSKRLPLRETTWPQKSPLSAEFIIPNLTNFEGYTATTLYVYPNVLWTQLLNKWTNIDETLHSAVYNLRKCMKEDNPGLKYTKGDN